MHIRAEKYMAWIAEQMLPLHLHVEKVKIFRFGQYITRSQVSGHLYKTYLIGVIILAIGFVVQCEPARKILGTLYACVDLRYLLELTLGHNRNSSLGK